jgi:formylglycine-generating enzyme required for sulfatase activity/CHAT domain-containing protein/lipopolysaccharide biosynthesis regulator YciM
MGSRKSKTGGAFDKSFLWKAACYLTIPLVAVGVILYLRMPPAKREKPKRESTKNEVARNSTGSPKRRVKRRVAEVHRTRKPAAEPPGPATHSVTEISPPNSTKVIEALQKGRQFFESGQVRGYPFMRLMRSIASQLPELKVSADPRRIEWNVVPINQSGVRFDAYRFRSPLNGVADMYWTFVSPDTVGNWQISLANTPFKDFHTTNNLRVPGVRLPTTNKAVFQEHRQARLRPNFDYVLWFARPRSDLTDFHVAIRVVPHGSTAPTHSAAEIARVIGMEFPVPQGLLPFQWFRKDRRSICCSADGRSFAACDTDGSVGVVGKVTATLKAPKVPVSHLQFSRGSELLMVASRIAKTVSIWNTKTGKSLAVFQGRNDRINGSALSPDGQLLVAFDGKGKGPLERSGELVFWDVAGRKELSRVAVAKATIDVIRFLRDGRTIVCGGGTVTAQDGRTLRTSGFVSFWNTLQRKQTASITRGRWIDSLDVSPDGSQFLTGSPQGTVRIWDVKTRRVANQVPTVSGVSSVCWSPDGKLVAISETRGTMRFYVPAVDIVIHSYLKLNDVAVSTCASGSNNRMMVSCVSVRNAVDLAPYVRLAGSLPQRFPHLGKSHVNSLGMRMVPLQGGRYAMGAPAAGSRDGGNERPQHFVHLSKAFYIANCEATVGQFRRFVAATGYKTDAEKANNKQTWKSPGFAQYDSHPVVCVSWNDATQFCRWLSKQDGRKYRLPREAEWEFACRAGETTQFPGGRDATTLQLRANVRDLSAKWDQPTAEWDDDYPATSPAGAFLGNSFGIRGMLGNVREWCSDWYSADFYSKAGPNDVDGPPGGEMKSVRGGSFDSLPGDCRFTVRQSLPPAQWKDDVGFRVAYEMTPEDESGFLPADPVARAALLRKRGEFARAAAIYTKLIADSENKSGSNDESTLRLVRLLAECYRLNGEFDRAVALYKRCFDVTEPAIPKDAKRVPRDLAELAKTYIHKGEFRAAEALLKKALESRTSRFGAEHVAVADVHFALGRLYRFLMNRGAAKTHFDRCLAIRTKKLETFHIDVGDAYIESALAHAWVHEYDKALPLAAKALQIFTLLFPKAHPRRAEVYIRAGGIYVLAGDNARGLQMFDNGLALLRSSPDYDSPSAIVVLRRYGSAYSNGKSFQYAEEFLVRAREIAERVLGPHDPEMIELLYELARCYQGVGKFDQAEKCCKLALKRAERLFGRDHPGVSEYHLQIGKLYHRMKRYDDAAAAFGRSLELTKRFPPGTTQDRYISLFRLGVTRAAQQRWNETIDAFDKGVRDIHSVMTGVLPGLPLAYRYSYAKTPANYINQPITIALMNRRQQALVDRSAEWVINMKGLVNDVMAEEALTTRDAKDPGTAKLAKELTDVRNQMASYAIRDSQWGTEQSERYKAARLWQRERDLAAELGRKLHRRLAAQKWVSLDDVRRKIRKGSVAIEIFRFKQFVPRTGYSYSSSMRYAAWIIPPAGEGTVQIVELGYESQIKKLVKQWQQAIQDAPALIARDGEKAATDEVRKAAAALSKRILKPLKPLVANYARWIISPDELLWLVPWGALEYDGSYLVENKQISTLISSRVLVEPKSTVKPGLSVVVANPDYNLGLPGGGFGRFAALPGTAKEATAIIPDLTRLTGRKPRVLLNKQALESDVRALKNPRILVLSTHGYFEPWNRYGHPLLQCGLALAGANGIGLSDKTSNNEGILTGLEALSIDLRGTELVVLSACESGLGQIEQSEGVAGLRQAFRLAGARSVVASLWQIPDRETAGLMSHFFAALAGGASKTAALQQAQVAMIKKRTAKNKAAHPIYWAAFVITGHAD